MYTLLCLQAAAVWARRGQADLLEVLAEIQSVLTDEATTASTSAYSRPEQADHADDKASVAAANAAKVEQVRMDLERVLGADRFLEAYRFLRSAQEAEAAQEAADSAADCTDGDGDAGDDDSEGRTQAGLERVLGPHLPQARQLQKLLMLEDAVFGY